MKNNVLPLVNDYSHHSNPKVLISHTIDNYLNTSWTRVSSRWPLDRNTAFEVMVCNLLLTFNEKDVLDVFKSYKMIKRVKETLKKVG